MDTPIGQFVLIGNFRRRLARELLVYVRGKLYHRVSSSGVLQQYSRGNVFCLAGCAPEQLLRPDESQAWLVAELRNIFMKTNRTFEFECGMRRADRKR